MTVAATRHHVVDVDNPPNSIREAVEVHADWLRERANARLPSWVLASALVASGLEGVAEVELRDRSTQDDAGDARRRILSGCARCALRPQG